MKKLVTLVIAIALVLSLGTLAAAEGPVKAYAVTVMSGGAAWGRFEAGFLEACEELGWEGHYLAPSTANDYTAMVQLTETALMFWLFVCPTPVCFRKCFSVPRMQE